jgi:hypothetical protein
MFQFLWVLFQVCQLEGSKAFIFTGLTEGASFLGNLAAAAAGIAEGSISILQSILEDDWLYKLQLATSDLGLHIACGAKFGEFHLKDVECGHGGVKVVIPW